MKNHTPFIDGFRAMLPITIGTIPSEAVIGTLSRSAGLSLFQTMAMNVLVYAEASVQKKQSSVYLSLVVELQNFRDAESAIKNP